MAALPTCFGSTDLVLARACGARALNGFRQVEKFDEKLELDDELAEEETAPNAPLPGSGPYLRDKIRIELPFMDLLFGRVLPDRNTDGRLTLFDRLPFEPRVISMHASLRKN